MKINIFLLLLISILSSHVSAATVSAKNERLDKMAAFDHTDHSLTLKVKDKAPKKPTIDIDDHFDPLQDFQIDEHRNFHAYNKGYKGLALAAKHSKSPKHVSSVPVPTAVWLFISGLVGMLGFTHRRKQRTQ